MLVDFSLKDSSILSTLHDHLSMSSTGVAINSHKKDTNNSVKPQTGNSRKDPSISSPETTPLLWPSMSEKPLSHQTLDSRSLVHIQTVHA